MPIRLNTLLSVNAKTLDRLGVFNGFIDLDSNFHVDPSLLESIDIPEFSDAKKKFDEYFVGVMKLLKFSQNSNDKFYKRAVNLLKFKEVPYISLGFSKQGNSGSGIGLKLAKEIAATGKVIVDAGIEDPDIFVLLGLFEENIGADRISDMTISILYSNFIDFTKRVCQELGIETREYLYGGKPIELPANPHNKGKPIILLPRDLLRKIPIAEFWSDIWTVEGYNDKLRETTNKLVGGNWRNYISRKRKIELKWELLHKPKLLRNLLDLHKIKPKVPYDFDDDPLCEFTWLELSQKALDENPLNLRKYYPVKPSNILEVIKVICYQLRQLIENNGWWEFLYDGNGKLRNERFAQKLLYGVADSYCRANNLDLNREPNAGSGPVDFKISSGYADRVTIEVKYSSNSNLLHGFETQLPIYNAAEQSRHSIYLVIITKNHTTKLNKLTQCARESKNAGKRTPIILFIDGKPKLSASKRLDEEE